MTDMVDAIADKLLEDHMSLMNECDSLRQQIDFQKREHIEMQKYNVQLECAVTNLRQRVAELEQLVGDNEHRWASALNERVYEIAAVKKERDIHYNRVASILYSGKFDKNTAGEFQAWEADYINAKEQLAAVEKERDDWRDLCAASRKDHEETKAECLEQARLVGMGSEREARLMGRLERSQHYAQQLREALEWIQDRCAGEAYPRWENTYDTGRSRALILDRTNFALSLPHDTSALVKDADRYRWLRVNQYVDWDCIWVEHPAIVPPESKIWDDIGMRLDYAIDEAMKNG